jgi:hypothetical protein
MEIQAQMDSDEESEDDDEYQNRPDKDVEMEAASQATPRPIPHAVEPEIMHIPPRTSTPEPGQRPPTIRPPPLGKFMTPQRQQVGRARAAAEEPVRHSMGGEGARRVPMETKWKVKDIVVPSREDEDSGAGEDVASETPKQATPTRRIVAKTTEQERKVYFRDVLHPCQVLTGYL